MAKKGARTTEMADYEVHVPLQAVLLADSFAQKFRPITLERPKVRFPMSTFSLFPKLIIFCNEIPDSRTEEGTGNWDLGVLSWRWFHLLPIIIECGQMLLPLVNVPMIDYTLEWLASAGVEECFVFCCAHANQITSHLNKSPWMSQPDFTVSIIESHDCVSAGDALRVIEQRGVV
jgi:hypothetical protein